MLKITSILYCLLLISFNAFAQTSLVPFGSSWRYLDNGTNQNTNWRTVAFKDTKWKTANGKFGYGISDAATVISFGSNPSKKYITTYFRKSISITDPAIYSSFTINVKRDDGAVVYVNGKEVHRSNMPTGNVAFTTLAKEAADSGTVPQSFSISPSAFYKGTNVIAVEIHQAQANTPDMAFDLELIAHAVPTPTDQIPPTVTSINRQNPTTEVTSASNLSFRVTFSEKVAGVDAADFTATTSGTVSGTVTSTAAVGTAGNTYDLTVGTVSGEGTLRLDLQETGTGIMDVAGNVINGGYTGGQSYSIQQPALEQPKVLYYEGFESGVGFTGMNIQTSTTYGFNVVGNPTYQDLKVGRWELRAGDPPASNGTRAEVLFSEDLAQQETWHSFVGYFPSEDNLIDTDDEAFNQWHQGSSFGRPMMTFRTENGRFEVLRRSPDGSKTHYYIMGSIIYDQWVHFVIHIKQHLTDGVMQVWINGELKMDYQGPTMFDGPIGRWKMGIYKSSWNNGSSTNSIKRVWYVDEVRVGNATSTYESIKPALGNNLKLLTTTKTDNLSYKINDLQSDTEQTDDVEVYPTLAKRGSTVILKTSGVTVNVAQVSDVTGRLFHEQSFTGLTSIETGNLPNGLYFISLAGENHRKKHKFIITD
ncbi:heparin lyase I family protein [Pontibacter lucknowensis]|uniref:Por secretion system C-terminal sorting domain-containing protein n=1 Tax=Pontibacter lucknowensis TaxID=1077936 RepID=A0A1N6UBF3_9BACT|nr:heparin lyase I family protein [Pontibacter lucknowensis]SIQ62897.1 Por secretion system C-terminal sorting domain-containing protein [Pontibacter lucknowensis]